MSFKETSLFEYLDVIHEDYGVRKVVYLERELQQVIDSYDRHMLWDEWQLGEREFAKLRGHSKGIEYARMATLEKRRLWEMHASRFDCYSLSYDELLAEPHTKIREIADFLELAEKPLLHALIEQKFRQRKGRHVYSTFS